MSHLCHSCYLWVMTYFALIPPLLYGSINLKSFSRCKKNYASRKHAETLVMKAPKLGDLSFLRSYHFVSLALMEALGHAIRLSKNLVGGTWRMSGSCLHVFIEHLVGELSQPVPANCRFEDDGTAKHVFPVQKFTLCQRQIGLRTSTWCSEDGSEE